METIDRFFRPPRGSFFLFGPRGTGKTTFLRRRFPKAVFLDLLAPDRVRTFSAAPERLRQIVEARSEPACLVIDEIQRVPELLPVVHSLLDSRRGWTFILTGSSTRKLKRAGVDLLGGRAALATMHPFTAAELGSTFNLDVALRQGLLPVVRAAPDADEALRAYLDLYLREEVMMEGLVRNIGRFSRFLEAICFSHASVLNVSNVARDCQIERKTVEGYVGILEDLLLGWRLPVFTKRAKRELSMHSKFYLFDAGVFRALRPKGPLDRPEEIGGQALEGLVAQHLKAWTAYAAPRRDLYYWRTRSGLEVDFVVYGPDGLWAIEVKSGRTIHPADLRGLIAFGEEYPKSRRLLLYRGTDTLERSGVRCVPCVDFLRRLRPDRTPGDAARAGSS